MALPTTPAALLALLAALANAAAGDYVLYNGEVLTPGQNLTHGPHHLALQPNCDLVLRHSGKPVWSSNSTAGGGGAGADCYAALKQNGELVVRRDVHYVLWSSGKKAKKGKYALVLDAAGHLGIYGQRRWTSNNPKESVRPPSIRPGRVASQPEYVLHSGRRLTAGKKLEYGEYELGLSRSCNLEINSTRSGRTLWQTNTRAATCFLELEANGEMVIKHGSQRVWSSNRKGGSGRYVAVLRFDGRFAVYGPLLWSGGRIDGDQGSTDIFPPPPSPVLDSVKEKILAWGMD